MSISSPYQLTTLYILFAIIATIFNLASQELVVQMYQGIGSLTLAIIIGTGVGLVCKYILDKKYIFAYQTQSGKDDAKTFVLYTAMGIITTFIFWGFEYGFDYVFQTKLMRYVGAVLGLAIGYYVKYKLDKKYVFV